MDKSAIDERILAELREYLSTGDRSTAGLDRWFRRQSIPAEDRNMYRKVVGIPLKQAPIFPQVRGKRREGRVLASRSEVGEKFPFRAKGGDPKDAATATGMFTTEGTKSEPDLHSISVRATRGEGEWSGIHSSSTPAGGGEGTGSVVLDSPLTDENEEKLRAKVRDLLQNRFGQVGVLSGPTLDQAGAKTLTARLLEAEQVPNRQLRARLPDLFLEEFTGLYTTTPESREEQGPPDLRTREAVEAELPSLISQLGGLSMLTPGAIREVYVVDKEIEPLLPDIIRRYRAAEEDRHTDPGVRKIGGRDINHGLDDMWEGRKVPGELYEAPRRRVWPWLAALGAGSALAAGVALWLLPSAETPQGVAHAPEVVQSERAKVSTPSLGRKSPTEARARLGAPPEAQVLKAEEIKPFVYHEGTNSWTITPFDSGIEGLGYGMLSYATVATEQGAALNQLTGDAQRALVREVNLTGRSWKSLEEALLFAEEIAWDNPATYDEQGRQTGGVHNPWVLQSGGEYNVIARGVALTVKLEEDAVADAERGERPARRAPVGRKAAPTQIERDREQATVVVSDDMSAASGPTGIDVYAQDIAAAETPEELVALLEELDNIIFEADRRRTYRVSIGKRLFSFGAEDLFFDPGSYKPSLRQDIARTLCAASSASPGAAGIEWYVNGGENHPVRPDSLSSIIAVREDCSEVTLGEFPTEEELAQQSLAARYTSFVDEDATTAQELGTNYQVILNLATALKAAGDQDLAALHAADAQGVALTLAQGFRARTLQEATGLSAEGRKQLAKDLVLTRDQTGLKKRGIRELSGLSRRDLKEVLLGCYGTTHLKDAGLDCTVQAAVNGGSQGQHQASEGMVFGAKDLTQNDSLETIVETFDLLAAMSAGSYDVVNIDTLRGEAAAMAQAYKTAGASDYRVSGTEDDRIKKAALAFRLTRGNAGGNYLSLDQLADIFDVEEEAILEMDSVDRDNRRADVWFTYMDCGVQNTKKPWVEELAQRHGVSMSTIYRDARLMESKMATEVPEPMHLAA